MNEQLEATNEISLLDIYRILRSHLLLILIFTFVIAALVTFYAYGIANPKYKSDAYVMIQVQVDPASNSFDLVNATRLLATAQDLISMPVVLEDVIADLGLDMTVGQLQSNLNVQSGTTSYFINISYISEDNQLSGEVVNAVIESTIDFANGNVAILTDNIIRTSYADDGIYESPNKPLYVVIGIILGGIIGIGFAFIKEFFNNTFKTKEQLEAAFGIQVLGVIPEFEVKEVK
ncbi:MAG: Wzz/FepE/Etk N-terminal domain-containing protein [Bacillota bacterium]